MLCPERPPDRRNIGINDSKKYPGLEVEKYMKEVSKCIGDLI